MRAACVLWLGVLLASGLAGCLDATPGERDTDGDVVDHAAIEALPHEDVRFQVVTRSGGLVDIAAYAWSPPDGAEAVVLAVHGSNGASLLVWGPLEQAPGYSLAHRVVATGRAFVAIDLPGYGATGGGEATSYDEYASIVDQVARQLREGSGPLGPYPTVTGLGWSMGAFVVMMTEGLHHPFDAIVPFGWSHTVGERARACARGDGCPPIEEVVFHLDNAEPGVVEEVITRNEVEGDPPPPGVLAIFTLAGCADCHAPLPVSEAVSAQDTWTDQVDVPVLSILGLRDFFVDAANAPEEPQHYPASADAQVLLLEETGHAAFHHRNHEDVVASLLHWLDERGL